MIELRTLGSVDLSRSTGERPVASAAQPKRLALLAYLALAEGSELRRRDVVVAQLWPDLDATHARGALRQALHSLRRGLDEAIIVTHGEEEIGVDRGVLWCDAVAFRENCAGGREREALQLYRGDFLAGFFASDVAPEFEQWIDETRRDLRRRAASCATLVSDEARAAGDLAGAVEFARRAVSLGPDDERAVARLIAILDQAGDRAGALDAYDALATRLTTEFGADPSPETRALIERVRARTVPEAAMTPAPSSRAHPVDRVPKADSQIAHGSRKGSGSGRRLRHAAVAAAAIVATSTAFVMVEQRWTRDSGIAVAVLPLENANGDTSQVYVADGLTDQLITDLAQVGTLEVINRRTMMAYRGSRKPPADIARELHAGAVVAGTLQTFGDTIRLTSQLVLSQDDRVIWAQTFEGTRGDLLRMQREVARAVAVRIRGALTPAQQLQFARVRAIDPEALDAYIRGRYYWNERRAPSLLRAIELFEQSLHADPTFALAYSAMGDAFVQLGYGNALAPGDAFPKARAAALRALSLDSSLAEPRATLAFVHLYYDWDWPEAEREFQRALTANPSYATAHEWYGLYLAAMGRFPEARAQEARAQELDPLSIAIAGTAGWILYYSRDFQAAKRELRIALRADTVFPLGHFYLGRVHQQIGDADSALAQYRATGPLRAWGPTVIGEGHLLASLGRTAEARVILTRLDSMSKTQYITAYGPALLHAALNQRDSAFAWLERAYTERTNWMVWLNRDPRWASVRQDPRFARIVKRMRLPD